MNIFLNNGEYVLFEINEVPPLDGRWGQSHQQDFSVRKRSEEMVVGEVTMCAVLSEFIHPMSKKGKRTLSLTFDSSSPRKRSTRRQDRVARRVLNLLERDQFCRQETS